VVENGTIVSREKGDEEMAVDWSHAKETWRKRQKYAFK
jgi:hypothetical protein